MKLEIKEKVEYQMTIVKDENGKLFRMTKGTAENPSVPYFLVDLDVVSDRVDGQIKDIRRTIHSQIHPKVYAKIAAIIKEDAANATKTADGNYTCAATLGYKLARHQNPIGAYYEVELPYRYEFTDNKGVKREAQFVSFFVLGGETPEKVFAQATRLLTPIIVQKPVADIPDDLRAAEHAANNLPPATEPPQSF